MAEEKKELTTAQQKKRYRLIQWSSFIGEFVAVLTPFVAIGIANYEKYFVQYNGTKMSIAFFMAMAVMGIAIWGITKKKLEASYVTFIIGWITFAFVFTLLGEMITDLAYIMWFGLIGLGCAYGLDIVSTKYKKKRQAIIDAETQASKDDMVEKVKAEKQAKVRKQENEKTKKYDGTTI